MSGYAFLLRMLDMSSSLLYFQAVLFFVVVRLKVIVPTCWSKLNVVVKCVALCFVFQRSQFQISAQRHAILKEVLCGVPHFCQKNASIVSWIMPQPLPSTSFPVYCLFTSPIIQCCTFWTFEPFKTIYLIIHGCSFIALYVLLYTFRFGMEKLLYDYGVDLAIWAHEHSYERLWPLYNYNIQNGSYTEPYRNPRAPVHIITGSAVNIVTVWHCSCTV